MNSLLITSAWCLKLLTLSSESTSNCLGLELSELLVQLQVQVQVMHMVHKNVILFVLKMVR